MSQEILNFINKIDNPVQQFTKLFDEFLGQNPERQKMIKDLCSSLPEFARDSCKNFAQLNTMKSIN
jgi:hypothetical protein